MKTITFPEIHTRVAEHTRREAARNAPVVVALDALNTIRAALIEMAPTERGDIRIELDALSRELDADAWQQFAVALATSREG